MKHRWLTPILLLLTAKSMADTIDINFSLPALKVDPYHKPYVAIWLESPSREGLQTIAIWYEKEDWLKDLRQWWRKLGRNKVTTYDTATGATRKPGRYSIVWDSNSHHQGTMTEGEYWLCFEASREAGGRDFIRQKIQLGSGEAQSYNIEGNIELGEISISIQP